MKEYKKIGILTFHSIPNYGSILQAYALQKTILKLGSDRYKCNIIDLRLNQLKNKDKKGINNIINKLYEIIYYKKNFIRANKFEEFISNKLILSKKKYYSFDKICNIVDDYNLLIVGSDEIWNVKSNNFSLSYFLPFNCKAKKISYAASFGEFKYISYNILEGNIKSYLSNFDYLSVRENDSANIIEKVINKKCQVLIDPVFLEKDTEWNQLVSDKRIVKGKYIFYYSNGSSQNDIKVLREIKKIYKMSVVMINSESLYDKLTCYKKILNCGPTEFLNLVKNAEVVCTNSYYGTAFSIIFKKNFYYIDTKENHGTKLLLKKLGIEDRTININNLNKINNKNIINFVKVENQLVNLRNYAIKFLRYILK